MRPGEADTEIPDVIEIDPFTSPRDLDWVQRKAKIPTVISKVFAVARLRCRHRGGPISAQGAAVATPPSRPTPPLTNPGGTSELWSVPASRQAAMPLARPHRPHTPPSSIPKSREERLPTATENVIRVDNTARRRQVLDLVGELIIVKSMMQELLAGYQSHLGQPRPCAPGAPTCCSSNRKFSRKLQRAVMKIRMVPGRTDFQPSSPRRCGIQAQAARA